MFRQRMYEEMIYRDLYSAPAKTENDDGDTLKDMPDEEPLNDEVIDDEVSDEDLLNLIEETEIVDPLTAIEEN